MAGRRIRPQFHSLHGEVLQGELNIGDVLSPHCQRLKNVIVARLDHFDAQENQWTEAVVEDGAALAAGSFLCVARRWVETQPAP